MRIEKSLFSLAGRWGNQEEGKGNKMERDDEGRIPGISVVAPAM